MSLSLGRPRTINMQDCTAKAPTNCDFPSNTACSVPISPGDSECPSAYTPHAFQHEVSVLIHQMLSLGANRSDSADMAALDQLHAALNRLLDVLPPAFRVHNPATAWDYAVPHIHEKRQQIKVTAFTFLLALHRQHARSRRESREAAVRAALEVLNAQQTLFEALGDKEYKSYMLAYYSMDAAIFIVTARAAHPLTDPKLAVDVSCALQQAYRRLSWMAARNSVAKSALRVLDCYQVGLRSSKSRHSAEAGHITQTFSNSEQSSHPSSHTLSQSSLDYQRIGSPGGWASQTFSTDAMALPASPFFDVTSDDYTLQSFLSQLDNHAES